MGAPQARNLAAVPGTTVRPLWRPVPEDSTSVAAWLLTEKQAAAKLNFSVGKLQGLRRSGQIGYLRTGRRVFYTAAQLQAWIAAHAQEARPHG